MFTSIRELVNQAEAGRATIGDVMLAVQSEQQGRDAALQEMRRSLAVMRQAARAGIAGVTSHSGLTGGNARRLAAYMDAGKSLTGPAFLRAITYALSTNEVNASMGLICAAPTAGACGVLPGVLLAAQEQTGAPDDDVVMALFCAGAIGLVVANNAMISGAAGGCQAEVGTASAMAAAALTQLRGGTPAMCAHAMAMALKNMLGLVCDPLAGLVEVPCVKRNAAGAANALAASEMALAGIESYVPWDEVISALYRVGQSIPLALRETAQGGLADTDTGRAWKRMLWGAG